jgi:hypothetical protein
MGDNLVTQGWYLASLCPSLVTQGLCSQQFVLQGLVGGEYEPRSTSGGAIIGGNGIPVVASHKSTSAGIGAGGKTVAFARTRCTTSGGQASGGRAAISRALNVLSPGGCSLGGSGILPSTFHYDGTGGVSLAGRGTSDALFYHVYGNLGQGGQIDYTTPIALVAGHTWTSTTVTVPGQYKLGVRAFDPITGLEDQNIDAAIDLVIDAQGNDVTDVPPSPVGLRAFPVAGGKLRVEWTCPCGSTWRQPTGFHVYLSSGSSLDYSQPASTVLWSSSRSGSFSSDVSSLRDGMVYTVAVRSFNAVGEEPNKIALIVTADSTPPTAVDSLRVVATNQNS